MTKPLTKELVVIPFLLVMGGCSVHAQSDSEDRPVAPFSRLEVQDGIDVYLTHSNEESLRVEVEGFNLDDIVAEVEGDTLTLTNEGRSGLEFVDSRRAKVYLDFVQLSAIEASSGSDIRGENELRLEELSVRASGGSDVDLAVQAESLEFTVSGGSDLRVSGDSDVSARSLESERAEVTLSGGSDASVHASEAIVVDARGGSDVSVYGDPAERTFDNDRSSDVAWR
ncbi:MAG TPA: head GIN domain-containing protein [Gammaproteobacteria bacterium]